MNPAQAAFRPPENQARQTTTVAPAGAQAGAISDNTESVGQALYRNAALPFEIASLLLLVAIVGAVLLARGSKQEKYYE
jgi:NADH-quinone oxidoreductase subunit J